MATDIFSGIVFAVIPSKDLSASAAAKLIEDVEQHGGEHCALSSTNLKNITHIISATADFPAFHDAVDALLHVVKPTWVAQSILKQKQANTRGFNPDRRMFMSSVVLTFADDIPQGDKDAIIGGVACFGGQYSDRLTKLCTHIVTLSADNELCRLVAEKRLPIKPVLPHWFDDCLKLRRLLATDPYTLPDPKILRPDCKASNVLIQSSQDIDGATSLSPDPPKPETLTVCSVFRGRTVKLDDGLNISQHLRSTLDTIITTGGGSLTKSTKTADTLICHFRSGKDYKAASEAGKDVGNLTWLYYLINWNEWISPTQRLLHYPLPKGGLANFCSYRISVSNYSGEARIYLENLIRAAGGTCTRNLAQDNTHLITAHSKSDKVDAAREWNLNIVNHLWLEESYARCEIQSVTNEAYTTFPNGTNLTQLVGQTQIDRDAVRAWHYPENAPKKEADTAKTHPTDNGGAQTPARPLDNKENETPPQSRGAKNRALNKLHKMAPDIAAYEKESKRVGGVVYGGRRVSDPDRVTLKKAPGRKRAHTDDDPVDDPVDDASTASEEDEQIVEPAPKKPKKKDTPVPRRNILTTFVGDAISDEDVKRLNEIPGSKVLQDIPRTKSTAIDFLIAPAIKRTTKFFAAVAAGAEIVGPKFVHAALKMGKLSMDPSYRLKDPLMEAENCFTLQDALRRARLHEANGGMLKGWTVYCTENVKGGPDMMRSIVELNGGSLILLKGRRTTAPPLTRRLRAKIEKSKSASAPVTNDPSRDENSVGAVNGQEADTDGQNRLFCLTVMRDSKLWDQFCSLATSAGYVPCLAKTEWLLRVALTQDLDAWQSDWEWHQNSDSDAAVTLKGVGNKRG